MTLKPALACYYYSYFSGIDQEDVVFHVRENCSFGGAPTNDDVHLAIVNWPASSFPKVRSDIEGHFFSGLEMAPQLAERVRAGNREEKWYGTAGMPNYFRRPYGPGWALVGDAGYDRDPITAQGISDSFIDAGG